MAGGSQSRLRFGCRGLAIGGLLFFAQTAFAQSAPAGRPAAIQSANRAVIEGRFDEAERALAALDARDPDVAAVKARGAVARGRYQEAESALAPAAALAPGSDAALELGLLQQMLGRPEGLGTLRRLVQADPAGTPGELARLARALRALGRFQDANTAYRDAAAAAPNDAAIQTAWGELFLEKYNKTEAVASFQAALKIDSKWVPALVGLAHAIADDNPPQAIALAKRALEISPSSVEARVLLAAEAADAGHHGDARAELQKALAVNPSSLEARSWLAALAYVEDKRAEFEAEVSRTLAIAPSYGEVYRVAGQLAAHNYRFDEAVALTNRAIAQGGDGPRAQADLGIHLLRTGDEGAARVALDRSFKLDPYNVVTYNLLSMLDTLDKFETVRDGDIVLRLPKDEAPVLREPALALAHQALKTISARWAFTPKGPILIEIFTKHDDFAVRIAGLPGMIGALGACFGRVVTMDSPKARPPGEFQWQTTLWHELAHVVTLQMSNQRVPRWLTEGMSEYETKRVRADWARPMDVEFAQLLGHGRALKLRDLNAAFMDPRTIELAYFESSLLVEHLVATYGDEGLGRLLLAYSLGLDTDQALRKAFDTDFDGLQVGFDRALESRFGRLRDALADPGGGDLDKMSLAALEAFAATRDGSFRVQMALGGALRKAGRPDESLQAFEKASRLVPMAHGDDSPHAQMAAIALDRGDRARAIAELKALMAVDFNNIAVARQLIALMKESGSDLAALGPAYERIAAVDPFDGEAHTALGRLAMRRNDLPAAALEFRTALALGPVDQAAALTDLADSYFRAGRRADAKKQVLAALEIAPTYQRAQDLLLQLAGQP